MDQKKKEAVAKALAAVPFAYTHRQLIDLIMVIRAAGTPEDGEDLVKQLRQDQLMHIIQGAQKAPEEFQDLVKALASYDPTPCVSAHRQQRVASASTRSIAPPVAPVRNAGMNLLMPGNSKEAAVAGYDMQLHFNASWQTAALLLLRLL
jgi:hypothetical protein